jgi:hydrogenase nickel incorporation protein HypA/HybF
MHELSIALSILEIAEEEAQRHNGAQIAAVHIKLGLLSGVVKEALIVAYEMASQTCGAPDSRLVIQEVPITVYCPTCQASQPIVSVQSFRCCTCGTLGSKILSGRELEVTGVEITE